MANISPLAQIGKNVRIADDVEIVTHHIGYNQSNDCRRFKGFG